MPLVIEESKRVLVLRRRLYQVNFHTTMKGEAMVRLGSNGSRSLLIDHCQFPKDYCLDADIRTVMVTTSKLVHMVPYRFL